MSARPDSAAEPKQGVSAETVFGPEYAELAPLSELLLARLPPICAKWRRNERAARKELLRAAAEVGEIRVLAWALRRRISPEGLLDCVVPPTAAGEDARVVPLEVYRWLHEHTSVGAAEARRIFFAAWSKDQADVADWVCATFPHFMRTVDLTDRENMTSLALFGNLKILRWLDGKIDLRHRRQPVDWDSIFVTAMTASHLELAQWVAQKFGPSAKGGAATVLPIFKLVCSRGELDAARWLYETFPPVRGLPAEKAAEIAQVPRFAGHEAVAAWLAAVFNLTRGAE